MPSFGFHGHCVYVVHMCVDKHTHKMVRKIVLKSKSQIVLLFCLSSLNNQQCHGTETFSRPGLLTSSLLTPLGPGLLTASMLTPLASQDAVGALTTSCILSLVGQTFCLPLYRRSKVHLIIFASLVPQISTLLLPIFKYLTAFSRTSLVPSPKLHQFCELLQETVLCLFHQASRVNTGTILLLSLNASLLQKTV